MRSTNFAENTDECSETALTSLTKLLNLYCRLVHYRPREAQNDWREVERPSSCNASQLPLCQFNIHQLDQLAWLRQSFRQQFESKPVKNLQCIN